MHRRVVFGNVRLSFHEAIRNFVSGAKYEQVSFQPVTFARRPFRHDRVQPPRRRLAQTRR